MSARRVSGRRLEELDRLLTDRDKAILRSLQKCRYLTSGQVQRLHFTEHSSQTAAIRAANRGLVKLQDRQLIESLERRIGGAKAGSGAYVWALTEAGTKLLRIGAVNNADMSRKRFFSPTPTFLEHYLAVAEAYVQLTEVCGRNNMKMVIAELEPLSWRGFNSESGKPVSLKPDLFAVVINGKYEDRWFIEIDLATESSVVILDKCKRYVQYYKTSKEQQESGVFPLVLWITPSLKRKESLQRHITDSKELGMKSIFRVITADEYETALCGMEALDAAKEKQTAQETPNLNGNERSKQGVVQ